LGQTGQSGAANLGRTRAFIKIADGCDAHCSYCIVPRLRGPFRSRAAGEIVDEAEAMARAGHRELVLTAIHLGRYGRDLDNAPTLAGLVRRIIGLEGLKRVRLSSVEAMEVDEDLLSLRDEPAFAPHFHLPLQSGNDEILRSMGRTYDATEFLATVEKIRERFELLGLSTDVIVGFPGESEEAFEDSLRLCREAGFTRVHAFPFSPREGTKALELGDPPPPWVVRRRMALLIREATALAQRFRECLVGREAFVLVERRAANRDGWVEGLDGTYQRVAFQGGPDDLGRLVRVEITGVHEEMCLGVRRD
jgi:threonylcarbamoyladenosine tRNA methylthiotransferase MtaB